MDVQRRVLKDGSIRWKVRWRQGDRYRAQTFDRKSDAATFAAEIRRRQALGTLAIMDSGRATLDDYVRDTWAPAYMSSLALKTQLHYEQLILKHVLPYLGPIELRQLTPDTIARWQADRLASGAGRVSVRQAFTVLGSILQRAFEGGLLQSNPARVVRKSRLPRRQEVRPLSPAEIEAMRAVSKPRDAALISVLGYAGLRPGEALGLQWRDIRQQTILIERAMSLGEEKDTKTTAHRTVRLLAPLAADLREWNLRSGRPDGRELIFPSANETVWTLAAYQSWRRRAFDRAVAGAGLEHARPYDLRHSFASLLLHEGRSVIYVARQLGHDARLTLTTYGHVMDEFEDQPQLDAVTAITAARSARDASVPADRPSRQERSPSDRGKEPHDGWARHAPPPARSPTAAHSEGQALG
jgi:integrase